MVFFLLRVYFYVYGKECLYHHQTTEPYLNLCATTRAQQITATTACKAATRPPPKVHQMLMKGISLGFRSQPGNRNRHLTLTRSEHNHEAFLHETEKWSWTHPPHRKMRIILCLPPPWPQIQFSSSGFVTPSMTNESSWAQRAFNDDTSLIYFPPQIFKLEKNSTTQRWKTTWCYSIISPAYFMVTCESCRVQDCRV